SAQPATVLAARKVRCSPCSPGSSPGCAWLRASHPLRCAPRPPVPGAGRESGFTNRTGKLRSGRRSAVMQFYAGPLMHLLSGVDNHGFLGWSDGTYTTIDPPGATSTYVSGINDSGQIVGWFGTGSPCCTATHFFLRLPFGAYSTVDVPGALLYDYFPGIN